MFSRILVPLDGSPLAEQVLPLARLIATTLRSSVELLGVVPPGSLKDPRPGSDRALNDALALVASTFEAAKVKATVKVVEGDPAGRIIAEAESAPDTLVAMSTHGRSGIQRWMLGSVTDRVAHHASVPVLIVRPQAAAVSHPPEHLATVIVPLDGSTLAEQALPVANQLTKALALHLVLVRAVRIPIIETGPDYGASANIYQEILDAAQQDAEAYLSRVAATQRDSGIPKVTTIAPIGIPASVILDTANALPDAITIMTSHGRSGVGRWLLGSVANHVIHSTNRPLLLVHTSQQQKR